MKETIYHFLKKIPKGKVVSYKMIAEHFGTSPRAIGKILNSNSRPNAFPCYKVVNSDGRLGGYNGGTEGKIRKLNADGILLIDDRIPAKYFRTIDPSHHKEEKK